MTLQEIIAALGQTWPARMGKDILQGALAPGRALQGQTPYMGGLRREDVTDIPAPAGLFSSVGWQPQDATIEPTATLAGIPMLATTGAPKGAIGAGFAGAGKPKWTNPAAEEAFEKAIKNLMDNPSGTKPSLTTSEPVLSSKSSAGVTLPTQPIVPLKSADDWITQIAMESPEKIVQTLKNLKDTGQKHEFNKLIGSLSADKWYDEVQPLMAPHQLYWPKDTVAKPKPQLIMSPEEEASFAAAGKSMQTFLAGQPKWTEFPNPQWTYGLEQHRIENPASLAERTARAKAQGYAGPTYHGSSSFEGGHLKPNAYGGAFRFWHTPNPKLAAMYAGVEPDYIRPGATLLPLAFRAPEYHTFDAKGKTWDAQFNLPTRGEFAEIINPEKALTGDVNRAALLEALEAKKTGGVVIKNVWDEPASDVYNPGILGSPQTTVITIDPSTLRSVHAQFDPEKISYNDLLAGLGGFGAAGAGLAALAPRGAEAKAVEGSSEPMFVPAMKEGIEYRRNLEEKKPRRPRTFQEEWENIMDELLRGTIPTAPWPGGLARAR